MNSSDDSKVKTPLPTQDLCGLVATIVSAGLGGVLETPLRWSRVCAALSGPLHPSCGHLQPSASLFCRWPSDLPLARFRPPTATHRFVAQSILAPLPVASAPEGLRTHPPLRFLGVPTARQHLTDLLPVVGPSTRTRSSPRALSRKPRSLSLPQVWRTDEGHRMAYGCRNPVSVSSRDATGSMNPLSSTRIPHARPSALHPSASLRNKSSLAASSTTTPLILHRPNHLLGAPCLAGMLHDAASPTLTLILRHN